MFGSVASVFSVVYVKLKQHGSATGRGDDAVKRNALDHSFAW
jgi:hypothetical protein